MGLQQVWVTCACLVSERQHQLKCSFPELTDFSSQYQQGHSRGLYLMDRVLGREGGRVSAMTTHQTSDTGHCHPLSGGRGSWRAAGFWVAIPKSAEPSAWPHAFDYPVTPEILLPPPPVLWAENCILMERFADGNMLCIGWGWRPRSEQILRE